MIEEDKETTTIDIKKAELISKELKTDIRVNAIDNHTIGKAYVIDTLPLTQDKTTYTLLQKDTKDSWVAMETTLSANESITRQFRRKKKASENANYGQIPTYVMLAMTTAALFYFVYLTLSRQLVIFEAKDIMLIILGFVLFVVIEILIFYYIHVQELDVIDFQSYVHPKMETYTIHFQGEIRSINAMLYRGRFVDFKSNTSKYIFGYNANEIQGGLKDQDGEFFIDKIRRHAAEKQAKESILADEYSELQKVKSKISTLKISKQSLIATYDGEETRDDQEDAISQLELEQKSKEDSFAKLEVALTADIQTHTKKINELQDNYHKRIQDILGEQIDTRKREEIVNADETISKLRNVVARQNIQMLGMSNSYNGVVTEYSKLAEKVDERVHMSLAESEFNNYSIVNHTNGQSVSDSKMNHQSGTNIDWGELIMKLTPVIVVSFVILMVINQISNIIQALSLLDSWAIAAVIFGLILLVIIVIMIISRIWNRGNRYSKDADASYLMN